MQLLVVVPLQVEGFHHWEAAPPEVSFLASPHRHIFHLKCKRGVSHADRDVEIILLKRRILEYMQSRWGTPCIFGGMSCEMIATELLTEFRLASCEVLEDGENGGEVVL